MQVPPPDPGAIPGPATQPVPPPGWYPDPYDPGAVRHWDPVQGWSVSHAGLQPEVTPRFRAVVLGLALVAVVADVFAVAMALISGQPSSPTSRTSHCEMVAVQSMWGTAIGSGIAIAGVALSAMRRTYGFMAAHISILVVSVMALFFSGCSYVACQFT